MTVLGEPPLAGDVIRQNPLDAPPEIFAVMGLNEVDELVDDNVLDYAGRQADGAPMNVEAAFGTARTPTVAQLPNVHRYGRGSDPVSKEIDAALYPGLAVADIPGDEVLVGAVALVAPQLEPATMKAER